MSSEIGLLPSPMLVTDRTKATPAQLYTHYQNQLATLQRELGLCLYGNGNSKGSPVSTPGVRMIIGYLELSSQDLTQFPMHIKAYSALIITKTTAPPDLLRRKALALTGWRLEPDASGDYRYTEEIDTYYSTRVVSPNGDMWAVVSFFGAWLTSIAEPFDVPREVITFTDDNWRCWWLATANYTIHNIVSITFAPDSVEATIDVPGQVAPYGSCGCIPGVSHFYPSTNLHAPFDELVTTLPPPVISSPILK